MFRLTVLVLIVCCAALPLSAQPLPVITDSLLRAELHRGMLLRLSGEWEAAGKWWKNGPDAKPVKSKGVARWAMNHGNYVYIEDSLSSKEDALWCRSLLSYDRAQDRMVMVRTNDPHGGLPLFSGLADSNFKLITLETPPAADSTRARIVLRVVDGNHHVMEFWQLFENGTQIKQREITYKRLR
ncbi:MAG: DUF1579 family protein [bacterium]|nr:DUF1579 family protein [bacterium]